MVKELPPHIKRIPPPENEPKKDSKYYESLIENGDEETDLGSLDKALSEKEINEAEYKELWRLYTKKIEFEKKRLKEVLHVDQLTGLSTNVKPVLKKMIEELEISGENEHRESAIDVLVVVYLDLNKFKDINDTYGHEVGNQSLIAFAGRMKEIVKEGTDLIFRDHGDEFVIIFRIKNRKFVSDEVIARLYQRLYRKLNNYLFVYIDRKAVELSASMGYTFLRKGDTATADVLLDRADKKMYADKHKSNGNPETK